jgi:hypothetical protein
MALQAACDVYHRIIAAQYAAQPDEAHTGAAQARLTRHAVVVVVVDVRKLGGTEIGVAHVSTVAALACGSLLYNSYSKRRVPALYGSSPKLRVQSRAYPHLNEGAPSTTTYDALVNCSWPPHWCSILVTLV